MRVSVFEHGFSIVCENDHEEWWLRAKKKESIHYTGIGVNPYFAQFCFDKPELQQGTRGAINMRLELDAAEAALAERDGRCDELEIENADGCARG